MHIHTSKHPFQIEYTTQSPDEGEIANHVMIRFTHPRFTVDVEHDREPITPLIPSKNVASMELPAGDGLVDSPLPHASPHIQYNTLDNHLHLLPRLKQKDKQRTRVLFRAA